MKADYPDFPRSRAILIGTSEYINFPQMPAAWNSLQAMQGLLTGPLCGWPQDRVKIFRNARGPDNVLRQLARLIRDTEDVLFLYYVGHGQPTLQDDLCMGLVETAADADEREFSGLLMSQLRRMLLACRARVKVLILDCCFSGIATENRQSPGDETAYIAGLTRVQGAYTLTASEGHVPARYEESPDGVTQFTKNLTELVQAGIPRTPSNLTLDIIFPYLEERLKKQRLPEPTRMSIGAGGSFIFAQNAAPPETHFDPDKEIQRLRNRIAEAEAREQELKAEAAERTRELEGLRTQTHSPEVLAPDQDKRLEAAVQEAAEKLAETEAARTAAQTERREAIGAFEQTLTETPAEPSPAAKTGPPSADEVAAIPGLTADQRADSGLNQSPTDVAQSPTQQEKRSPDQALGGPNENWPRRRTFLAAGVAGGITIAAVGVAEILSHTGTSSDHTTGPRTTRPTPSGSSPKASPTPTIQPTLRWVKNVGTSTGSTGGFVGVDSSLAFSNNVIFGAGLDKLYAFDAGNGKQKWFYQFGADSAGCPVAAAGIVYLASKEVLYAFDATSGNVRWHYQASKNISGSVAVASGTVYAGSGSGIHAIDASAGGQRWQRNVGAVTAGPAASGGLVYARIGNALYALDAATGNVRWNSQAGDGAPSPAAAAGSVYLAGGSGIADVYAFSASNGETNWHYHTGGVVLCVPAIANGIVYVGSEDYNVHAMSAFSGKPIWKYPTGGYVYSSPAVANGVVYIGSLDQCVYALDAAAGTLRWRYKTNGPICAGLTVANGVVYARTYAGSVYALAKPT